MKLKSAILLTFFLPGVSPAQVAPPYLSNLHATKDSPLYTTYAAAMARSEFTLDKGYHFVFYDSTRGADFTNETGGSLCLAFKKNGKFVYALKDMYRQPVITASYADMVLYTFLPFEDIQVDVTFLVYSSHHALQAIDVKNLGSKTTRIEVLPFLQNTYRTYDSIEFHKDVGAITFTHDEFPDDWVLKHGVPYTGKVQDAYVLSDPPDRMMSFQSYRWGKIEIPHLVDLERKPRYYIHGRVQRPTAAREAPIVRLMAVLNNDPARILTENAPRWGSAEKNLGRGGTYVIELGNFPGLREGDRFTISAMSPTSGFAGEARGVVRSDFDEDSTRSDLLLSPAQGHAPVEGVKMDIWGSGVEVRLSWKRSPGAVSYNVYRRDYNASGLYELIGAQVRQTFFTDKNLPPEKVYGYVITAVDSSLRMSMHSEEVNTIAGSDFLTDVRFPGQGVSTVKDFARIIAFSRSYELRPGSMQRLIAVRSVAPRGENLARVIDTARGLTTLDLPRALDANEKLYSIVPPPRTLDAEQVALYWSAFSLMRQVMLPPEARCKQNYYVFSREPQWGWGHGGQVFHESLTMLAYAYMDPTGAMNSQRIYMERQKADGYINYRSGPYLDEEIPREGQLTTSAPWYAWQNWEVYKITHDRKFLEDAYRSSAAFYRYLVKNRDADGDGLCEWGADAVLESVRDGLVAVWDQVGWPSNFEAVDLNAMLVSEAKSLGRMARELSEATEAEAWERDARERSAKINATMWDKASSFYYNVDRKSHTFTYKREGDLKRQEIIGFLPLWAGIASKEQAEQLVAGLRDTSKFWRKFGVPSLAADDPYYDPKGYWNGPLWVQWDYLIVRGLLDYGYVKEARELTRKVADAMVAQLKKDHDFWEFYSPDEQWAGYHKTYIWAGIIARMMRDITE